MRKSIFFYKELTPAEVGKTGTHEVYVRLPNNFDYETFFGNSAVLNGSVMEVNFTAQDITNGGSESIQLRFVYFKNSNQEKRIPSLGSLFKSHNVQEGDIVSLESRIEGTSISYYLCFYKKGEIQVNPAAIYFSRIDSDQTNAAIDSTINQSLQQIFYGAPGTGKSNTIKREVDDQGKLNYRTTFHPDSDYSTFVGCYKPKMKRSTITKDGVTTTDEKIIYSFEPQAFTNAYVQGWKTQDDVYLIIEEINRGNCAQIFGDLFQLLDRKNGESEYPVDADSALADYLQIALADSKRDDIPTEVKNGTKLKLPSNLYIWATMNTSDQSLFPIDSAFKRRWEWKYMRIKNEGKEWKIDVKIKNAKGEEMQVEWWDFIHKVNDIIASMTSSADKQLGYFFCKPDKKTSERAELPNSENDLISVDTFVSKVLFYLWNDVFKDYGFEDASLFQYKDNEGKVQDLTFPDFYKEDSNDVNPTMVADFVQKVMNWKKKEEEN